MTADRTIVIESSPAQLLVLVGTGVLMTAAIRRTREGRDVALDFSRVAYAEGTQLHAERRRDRTQLAGPRRYGRVPKYRHSRHPWRDLFE